MLTRIGAHYQGNDRCDFRVWAPWPQRVELRIMPPRERTLAMESDRAGYWQATVEGAPPGSRYVYVLEGTTLRPDPASHFQPEGVHGPSEVVNHSAFPWTDAGWEGVGLEDMLIYELHVGTFTRKGTFEAILPRLPALRDLGVTAVELMPVAQFPGQRNWGYDGAYPYAVQDSYGGPNGLKTLVNAIHHHGISAILDVVYNHTGPEGSYLRDFGPYFTDKYKTPWGDAINFDQAHSNHVRNFFIENALYWLRDYHFDALRLDALHTIYDQSAKHVLQELAEHVARLSHQSGRKYYLIGESDLNDVRFIKPPGSGGYGLDAQWSDDFHHSLHALLTGERGGYYEDFGSIKHVAKAFREGFVYSWQYSPYRKRLHGSSSRQRPARQLVVCTQNHDQIGNRLFGERLSMLVDFESLKLAAGVLLLSPYVPLLFMGQEYGENVPFYYFVSHTGEALIQAVRQGRRNEFKAFALTQEYPDPAAESTFLDSKLRWEKRDRDPHRILLAFYKRLVELRNSIPNVVGRRNMIVQVFTDEQMLAWHRRHTQGRTQCVMNFSNETQEFPLPAAQGAWRKALDSADVQWAGPGSTLSDKVQDRQRLVILPRSIAVYEIRRAEELETRTAQAATTVEETI